MSLLTSGKHLARGEGSAVWVLGDLYTFKLDSEQTDGAFALWETFAPVGNAGPPPHSHMAEDETFILLDGELDVEVEGDRHSLRPGSVLHVPLGTVHTFRNNGQVPARFLVMVTPGGFERFFKAIGEEANDLTSPPEPAGPPDPIRLATLAREYNCEIMLPGGN